MKKKKFLLMVLALLSTVLFIYSFSFAKYTSNSIFNYYLKSNGFYLQSDDLTTNGKQIVNTLWNKEKVYFNIRNSEGDTLISDYDINYVVNCEIVDNPNLKCLINDTDNSQYNGILSSSSVCLNDGTVVDLSKADCEMNGYNWLRQVASKDLFFEVVSINDSYEIDDVKVNIVLNSTNPYKKTLKATYVLNYAQVEEGQISKEYEIFDNYNRLIITNSYLDNKCILLSWDGNKHIVDTTNSYVSYMDSNGYINGLKFNIDAKSSTSLIFYDRNDDNDGSDFIIDLTECN